MDLLIPYGRTTYIHIKFNEDVRKFRLIEPAADNAYKTLQDAILNKQPAALVEDIKLDLEAVLRR